MEGYSKYFSFNELTDSDSFPELVVNNRIDAVQFQNAGKRLSKLLETVREVLGGTPIEVSSGFRNKLLNSAVGSKAKNSAHQRFEAVDISKRGVTIDEMFKRLIEAHKEGSLPDLRKVIREDHKGILHIEVKMDSNESTDFYTTKDNVKFNPVKSNL